MYELIEQKPVLFKNTCLALAFNGYTLIIVNDEQIIIYFFHDGKIRKTQRIVTEFTVLKQIYMTKISPQFICYGENNSIQIWKQHRNQVYYMIQEIIDAHQNRITCVIMNKQENLLLTSSKDTQIKFWKYNQIWYLSQTLTCHQRSIHKISFNNSQNQLVSSCGFQIVVSELQIEWVIKQIIQINDQSAMFYGDQALIIQDRCFSQFQVYELCSQTGQFQKASTQLFEKNQYLTKDIIAINEQKSLIVLKNGMDVLFLKKSQDSEYIFLQRITINNLNTPYTLSDDGAFFILCDGIKLIVRKFQ